MKRVTEKAKTRVIGRGSDPGVNHGPQVLHLFFPASCFFFSFFTPISPSSPLLLLFFLIYFFVSFVGKRRAIQEDPALH